MMPPPDAAALRARSLLDRVPAAWRTPLLHLGLVWAALVVLFRAQWAEMARQWWDISTYNHILLIPVLLGWMTVQRAPELAKLTPRPWWPALALFGAAAFLWLLGAFTGLSTAAQLGAVGMLASAVPAVLGLRVAVGLLFPLCYMALLVPFGDELVPTLQMVTAGLVIMLVRLSGIPAFIDGVFIDTPAGLFEVAEACSGVKFLIAMIAFGLLVANICFRRWPRRVAFFAFCLAVPVLANGVRAWATVFAAQYVGAERATGFDHIVYGWVFFGVVIALVLASAWRFFDRPVDDPIIDAAEIEASPLVARLEAHGFAPWGTLLAIAAVAGGAQLWAHAASDLSAPMPPRITLPEVTGWRRIAYTPQVWWQPRAAGADHRLLGRYADAHGRQVDVFLALYASQDEGREATGFGEGALQPGQGWSWLSPGPTVAGAKTDRLLARGRVTRLAETYYRTGAVLTGSAARLKFANMQDRLLLRARPTALLILSAEERPGQAAETAVSTFRRVLGPIDAWMDHAAALR